MNNSQENCPKCGAPLGDIVETKTGRKLRRCSTNVWNPDTKQAEGCDFVQWLDTEPQQLDEKCPKCDSPLVLKTTKFGKKLKCCSTNKWNPQTRQAEGCDYIQWINSSTEPLDETCPECGEKLVLFTTAKGRKMKKCSAAGWDKTTRQPTGCPFIQWL